MKVGRVVKLDRGYPLVHVEEEGDYRCEHATALLKGEKARAVIGDRVKIKMPEGHDKAIISEILPRKNAFVRKDPTEQALPQVLAANFNRVIIAQPLAETNIRRLERELVLAHETGAQVAVILTKADLAEEGAEADETVHAVEGLLFDEDLVVVSTADQESLERVRALVPPGDTAILIGKSGVGKSSLINMLVGEEIQETAEVREADGKGRHTTVSREMIAVPGGGFVVDMPGVRGLGLWNAEAGIETAFADIEEIARDCRFRDCKHESEPGCAVQDAVGRGEVSPSRLGSYRGLRQETEDIQERREEAARIRTRTGHPRRHTKRKQ